MSRFTGRLRHWPDELLELFEQRLEEQGASEDLYYFDDDSSCICEICTGFDGRETREGVRFWNQVLSGDLGPYFARYGKGVLNSKTWE